MFLHRYFTHVHKKTLNKKKNVYAFSFKKTPLYAGLSSKQKRF